MRTKRIVAAVALVAALAGCGTTDEWDCTTTDRNRDGDPVALSCTPDDD